MNEQRLLRNPRTQLRHKHGDVEVLHVHAGQDAPHGRLTAQPTAYLGQCGSRVGGNHVSTRDLFFFYTEQLKRRGMSAAHAEMLRLMSKLDSASAGAGNLALR
jgi:hypothetical protein